MTSTSVRSGRSAAAISCRLGWIYAVFDFAVTPVRRVRVKSLQKVAGVREDGHIGEQTLASVRKYSGGIARSSETFAMTACAKWRFEFNLNTFVILFGFAGGLVGRDLGEG